MPAPVGVVPQPGADARGVRRRHPHRLSVHRGQLRSIGRGGGPVSIWVLRGLRDGVVTTRWPARPDPYADAWRGPARPVDPTDPTDQASTDQASTDQASTADQANLADLCPTGAITVTD